MQFFFVLIALRKMLFAMFSFGRNFYNHESWLLVTKYKKKEKKKRTVSTQKNERPLVGLFQQSENRHLLLLSKMTVIMKMINKTLIEAN